MTLDEYANVCATYLARSGRLSFATIILVSLTGRLSRPISCVWHKTPIRVRTKLEER